MFNGFLDWARRLFGRPAQDVGAAALAARAEADYRRVDAVNFTYIFANRLANLAVADASLNVSGGGARALALAGALEDVFQRAHKLTAQALGSGGRVLLPYLCGGQVRFEAVAQDRFFITGMDGGRITSAAVLADRAETGGRVYYRWTDYALENGVQRVRSRVTDAGGRAVEMGAVPQWANLPGEAAIAGVEKLTLAFLRCPVDNRRERDGYGVPITYGCEALMDEIHEHMRLIAREYRLTRPMLGLSAEMWRQPFEGGESGVERARRTVQDGDDPFIPIEGAYDETKAPWLVYAPAIRNEAMYDRLEHLFAMLEKAVGTSRGILTARETATATATEIRAANHDTLTLVTAIRRMWEQALDDMAYAADVLCEHYGLTPAGARGEYAVQVDWDMSLFESGAETFEQLCQLHDRDLLSGAELRQWVRGGALEEAQGAIDKIAREREALSGADAKEKNGG